MTIVKDHKSDESGSKLIVKNICTPSRPFGTASKEKERVSPEIRFLFF